MGNKHDRRIFRKRRRRAGFALVALLTIVLGGLFFLTTDPVRETTASGFVERVTIPVFAAAPGAVEEPDKEPAAQGEAAARDQGAANERDEGASGGGGTAEDGRPAENDRSKEESAPPPPDDPTLYLTVPKMGLYNNVVANSSEPTALDYGAAKLEESGFPWQNNANTYISAHRLGWPGTPSDHQFYNLPLMDYGDEIYLTDTNGTTYTYEVTEVLEVSPQDVWVASPEEGRDMVSLQTCTEDYGDYWTMGPDWAARYVVRADKVDVTQA